MSNEEMKSKKDAVEKEFNDLNEKKSKLIEQGRILNQQVSEIDARHRQLQGAYQTLRELLGEKIELPQSESKTPSIEEPKK